MSDSMQIDDHDPRGTKRTAEEAGLPPQALEEAVVNKIAAGEIIVAPVNALKEMLENSVDAGATSVDILVKDGGLKLLQITDNGSGIEKEDLPILCQRHTTSKLQNFEDLMSIGTYGFRGEALASISHIAHLRVTTKTMASSCAWQAHYGGGVLVAPKPGQSADPKPCAGRQGTQITVEDLFYNTPSRRKAFRAPSEEYAKILDMVTKYAIHCEGVAFSVKKYGESGAGFTVTSAATTIDRIKQAHGTGISKELIEFTTEDARWGFKATGFASNANYSVKRTTILLFINHRAVESSAVKKAIDHTYHMFLPKGGHPFVYLSLEIDPARVDVNVHPTKREVHFLNEDEIIDHVCVEIRQSLAKVDTSRTFHTQTLLPGVSPMTPIASRTQSGAETPLDNRPSSSKPSTTKRPYENSLVRTDSKMRKITSMLPPALLTTQSTDDSPVLSSQPAIQYEKTDREPIQVRLTSVKNLRATVRESMHEALTETFASLTYVGLVDSYRRLAAMQSGVKLLLVDYGRISNEFFYQIGLTEFGNFGSIRLDPAPSLEELLNLAAKIEVESEIEAAKQASATSSSGHQGDDVTDDVNAEEIAAKIYAQLMSRREMLSEYFSLTISDTGNLETIPMLLKGYLPSLAKFPAFLLRLGPFVDWTDEEACFRTFLTELASFYVPEQIPAPSSVGSAPRTTTVPQTTPRASRNTTQVRSSTEDAGASADVDANADVDTESDLHGSEARDMIMDIADDNNNQALLSKPSTENYRDNTNDIINNNNNDNENDDDEEEEEKYQTHLTTRRAEIEHALEHILFPAFRARLLATKGCLPGVVEVANLKGLYRVFERC